MTKIGWRKAIKKVLNEAGKPLHYRKITEIILDQGLAKAGATPANTVAAMLSMAVKDPDNPIEKFSRGVYFIPSTLKTKSDKKQALSVGEADDPEDTDDDEALDQTGAVRSYGVFWQRSAVIWRTKSRILGKAANEADTVDFQNQRGIYLLLDGHRTIYVGRAVKDSLGSRLFSHTTGRLSSRWDRFSWFGFKSVNEDGSLTDEIGTWSEEAVISAVEAVLIESMEPAQNRRGGDHLANNEFFQVEDPDIERTRRKALMLDLLEK